MNNKYFTQAVLVTRRNKKVCILLSLINLDNFSKIVTEKFFSEQENIDK